MKHRSDKFLRQDLIFCYIFALITEQSLNSRLFGVREIFESRNQDREFARLMLLGMEGVEND